MMESGEPWTQRQPQQLPDPGAVRLSVGLTPTATCGRRRSRCCRAQVRASCSACAADFPDLPLRLISALAEGGDQLVAEEALALGVELVAALADGAGRIRARLRSPGRAGALSPAAGAGRAVRELPLAAGNDAEAIRQRGEARNRQYAQLGMFISSHCQVLLALWDGRPSEPPAAPRRWSSSTCATRCPAFSVEQAAPNLLPTTRATSSSTFPARANSAEVAQDAPPPPAHRAG
jgi:hypothetical protein